MIRTEQKRSQGGTTMTDQIITITGLEFTTEGRPIAHGAIIREGAGTLEETMKAGGAQMGTLHPMDGCPMGRVEAKFAGQTATAVFFGERFLLAAEDERKSDWLSALRRLVAAL
jgi:hypothetical protein